MKLGFRILAYTLLPIFAAAFIVGDVFAHQYAGLITAALNGNTTSFEGDEVEYACQMGDSLGREIEEEGIVLLKNDEIANNKKSLPLDDDVKKVNVFGWGSTQFLQRGVGSGSSDINKDRSVNFLEALEAYGISYNKNITNAYQRWKDVDITKKNTTADYNLYQPTVSWHQSLLAEAKDYSETAILVIHRVGGENIGEIPVSQTLVTESTTSTDNTRTYLQISKHEEDLIDLLSTNFSNVVLVLNTTNPMHLPILDTDKIDSCISVGITGQSGAIAIPYVLWGKKTVNNQTKLVSPSGKLTDIISYSPETSPAFANYKHASNHIQYLEDIYYGYRWYETADAVHYWDSFGGYDNVVQFPFGHGLSYSKFEWSNMQTTVSTGSEINKDTSITVSVTVKNTGNYPAKDVVELYVSPSYQTGGIEKSSIVLVDFEKTRTLNPNDTQIVELHFDLYDIASYDCYDDNNNGFKGYEVDYGSNGEYVIKLMTDSHHEKEMSGANSYTLNIPTAGIRFENDNVTNHEVSNRMTGDTAYAGIPIDGSTVGAEPLNKYLSRSNFVSLFPSAHAKTPTTDGTGTGNGPDYICDFYQTDTMPNVNPVENNLRIATLEDGSFATLEQLSGKTDAKIIANDALIHELEDYDNAKWNQLLDQISIDDMFDLVENGGFKTYPIDSVGKPRAFDTDGPAGFNLNTVSMDDGDGEGAKWTAYPSETVIGQTWNKELAEKMGLCMGMEAQATKVQGWYAPGVNLHRTPYTARNYEYYSEDPILSGILAAKVIDGARTNGLYCYLKHFVLSEPGPNPRKLNTWVSEQNLRENYLKPFEIAVKKGHATAIMSAFNRVGSVWAGASYPCLTQILRDEWGFRGSVITDYAGTGDTALGNMNPNQGVRAGNSLWLNPATYSGANALTAYKNNATTVNAVRHAVKDILYTYIDAYFYGTTATTPYDGYKANVSMSITAEGDAWWIPLLISIEVTVIALLSTYFAFALASGIKIYLRKHPKTEKVKREPKPLYITKRMKKGIMWIMMAGGVTGLLLVILVPLFNDILVDRSGTSTIVPVDTGEVFGTKFEFEDGLIEGNSLDEDHLCFAKTYFYNMDLSNSGAITNLSENSKISFKFVSSKSYRVSLNIRMASVYDESQEKWVEANLKDYLSLSVNGSQVKLDDFKIPASNKQEKLEGYTDNDMNMVNVIGIPVTLSNISNSYEFTLKENCPALDSFTIYTSATLDDFNKSEQVLSVGEHTKVTEVPSKTQNGKVTISCSNEGCNENNEYSIPLLTSKKWYAYDSTKNAYTLDVYGRKYVITPDTADSLIGPIHSECKNVPIFTGNNFFEANNWNYRSSTSQKLEDRTYSMVDIIDGEGNVVLTDTTYAKTEVFYWDKQKRKGLVDWNTASTADYLGKTSTYTFTVNATGEFTMTAFGSTYSDAKLIAKNSVPGVFFKFKDNGKISLTIGTDAGSPANENKKKFRTTVDFITADSVFNFNQDNEIKFIYSRKNAELFELALFINDTQVILPEMGSSTTGDLTHRYTQNGKLYIYQTSEVSHTWGEFVAFSPSTGYALSIKDLEYGVE